MYRQYEDPRALEKQLREAERNLSDAMAAGCEDDYINDLYYTVCEYRDRVNFAWQDDEWG